MIFVTTGTQEPFDRLIMAMDQIAPKLNKQILAQVCRSSFTPKHLVTFDFLSPSGFNSYFTKADLIISHAGMGTIISALVQQKPILIVPRLAKLGEHRNDHQLATSKAFEKLNYVHVAYSTDILEEKIITLLGGQSKHPNKLGNFASKELLNSIHEFIHS